MGTTPTSNHGWAKPVFPSATVDTELDSLFDAIDESTALRGTEANLPAAGTAGRLYFTTDTKKTLWDDGVAWVDITPKGTTWSISDGGTKVMDVPADMNFGTGISVVDDADGTVTITGHAPYTDENAQDAVGAILGAQFAYDDVTPAITLNQGAGSGLDADTLDGTDSTGYASASHTHGQADITDFSSAAPSLYVQSTAPSSPATNDIWFDTS